MFAEVRESPRLLYTSPNSSGETVASDYDRVWKKTACWLAGCAALLGLGNFVICTLAYVVDWGTIFHCVSYFWMGIGFSQGGLHSIWCVFAPVRVRTKIAIAVALPVFWCGTAFLGTAIHFSEDSSPVGDMLAGFLCISLL